MPQFWSIAVSQSVFFGVPEKVVFAKNCRLKTGEAQVTAADAGAAVVSRVPAVASDDGGRGSRGRASGWVHSILWSRRERQRQLL